MKCILILFLSGWGFPCINRVHESYCQLVQKVIGFTLEYNPKLNLVHLHWVSSGELKNDKYIVERSLDSLHYEELGETQVLDNSGNEDYYFDDMHPMGGKVYYRIEEVGPDDIKHPIPAKSVFKPLSQLELSTIYDEGTEMIRFVVGSPRKSSANISLMDVSGHIEQSYLVDLKEGSNIFSTSVKTLQSGIYFLQINDQHGQGSLIRRFIRKTK